MLLGSNHPQRENIDLVGVGMPFPRWGAPPGRKFHIESGLNQRDRATRGFDHDQTHRKQGKKKTAGACVKQTPIAYRVWLRSEVAFLKLNSAEARELAIGLRSPDWGLSPSLIYRNPKSADNGCLRKKRPTGPGAGFCVWRSTTTHMWLRDLFAICMLLIA